MEEGGGKKRKVLEDGDDCPICYESMQNVDEATLEFCETCLNAIHKECFGQCETSSPSPVVLASDIILLRACDESRKGPDVRVVSLALGGGSWPER